MIGHSKDDERDNTHGEDRFQWVKGKCCPGCRGFKSMVGPVDQGKYPGMVHEAVRPVKIGIMQEDHRDNAQYKIGHAVGFNGFISKGHPLIYPVKEQPDTTSINKESHEGILYFFPQLAPPKEFSLYFQGQKKFPANYIENRIKHTGNQKVTSNKQ